MSKIFLNFVEIKFILIKSSALDEGQINMFIMNTQLVLDFGKLSYSSPGPWLYLDLKDAINCILHLKHASYCMLQLQI